MNSSVAIVIPEIGFDEVPICPVMRDETVTKKKPKTRISNAESRFTSSVGISTAKVRIAAIPISEYKIGMSRSVRGIAALPAAPPLKSLIPALKAERIVGSERIRLTPGPLHGELEIARLVDALDRLWGEMMLRRAA